MLCCLWCIKYNTEIIWCWIYLAMIRTIIPHFKLHIITPTTQAQVTQVIIIHTNILPLYIISHHHQIKKNSCSNHKVKTESWQIELNPWSFYNKVTFGCPRRVCTAIYVIWIVNERNFELWVVKYIQINKWYTDIIHIEDVMIYHILLS